MIDESDGVPDHIDEIAEPMPWRRMSPTDLAIMARLTIECAEFLVRDGEPITSVLQHDLIELISVDAAPIHLRQRASRLVSRMTTN